MNLFTTDFRNRVSKFTLDLAQTDPRIVSAAVVGSMALGPGDRWSDLDLTFAVEDSFSMHDVLADWTGKLEAEFGAVRLFDLPSGPSIYRVFLLPGALQFDLSFTPASSFGAVGPKFRLLFGEAVERVHARPPAAADLFGYAAHHALRARFCIERGRAWQAEHWIHGLRDYALHLACLNRGLPANNGRGFDDLPPEVLERFQGALAGSLEREDLLRALAVAIEGLLAEAVGVVETAEKAAPELRRLTVVRD